MCPPAPWPLGHELFHCIRQGLLGNLDLGCLGHGFHGLSDDRLLGLLGYGLLSLLDYGLLGLLDYGLLGLFGHDIIDLLSVGPIDLIYGYKDNTSNILDMDLVWPH